MIKFGKTALLASLAAISFLVSLVLILLLQGRLNKKTFDQVLGKKAVEKKIQGKKLLQNIYFLFLHLILMNRLQS